MADDGRHGGQRIDDADHFVRSRAGGNFLRPTYDVWNTIAAFEATDFATAPRLVGLEARFEGYGFFALLRRFADAAIVAGEQYDRVVGQPGR